MTTTQNSRIIDSPAETIYRALTEREALEAWLAPANMTGKVHSFELKVGGSYTMSLFCPESEKQFRGKTAIKEDRFTASFLELIPPIKIVEAIKFHSEDPAFAAEMIMEVTLQPVDNGTRVTFLFKNIPPGIRPEDNEAGTLSTLEKLARYVE